MISQGFPSYELDHTPASIVALEEVRLLEPARRICRRAQTRRRDRGPLSTTQTLATENGSLVMKTAIWVAAIASTALIFDGYDLVVFGTVMPTLMNDPSQIGPLDPSIAGTVGSLALIGVLLGSFASGFIGDILGRKRMLMIGIAWFSSGMAITALTGTVFTFGLLRFLTGLGRGLVIAVAGVGILGTQVLVYGFQASYYTSNARAAGAAMCASQQFYVFAVVALLGAIVTVLVPRKHNTYLIERRLVIDGDAKPEEVRAAREAAAESPLVEDGASVPAQGLRTGA